MRSCFLLLLTVLTWSTVLWGQVEIQPKYITYDGKTEVSLSDTTPNIIDFGWVPAGKKPAIGFDVVKSDGTGSYKVSNFGSFTIESWKKEDGKWVRVYEITNDKQRTGDTHLRVYYDLNSVGNKIEFGDSKGGKLEVELKGH